jgi:hypothetical protein
MLHRIPNQWAEITLPQANKSEQLEQQVFTALNDMSENGRVTPGKQLSLARFITVHGGTVEIKVIEGTFQTDAITPEQVWKEIGRDLLLVNSVDEHESTYADRTMAPNILAGCGLKASRIPDDVSIPPSLHIGGVNTVRCGGNYNKDFGIEWIANVAVVVKNNQGGMQQSCEALFAGGLTEQGQACVAKALNKAIGKLFEVDIPKHKPEAVILPSVATGQGSLETAVFYQTLESELVKRLMATESSNTYILPKVLYFQIWSQDSPQKWDEKKRGISNLVASLVADWQSSKHEPEVGERPTLAGIAGGLALLLVITATTRVNLINVSGSNSLSHRPGFASVAGWFFGSFALAAVLKPILTSVPEDLYPWPQVCLAFLAVFFCGPLMRIIKQFDEMLIKQKDASR